MKLSDIQLREPFQKGVVNYAGWGDMQSEQDGEGNYYSKRDRLFSFTIDADSLPESISPLKEYDVSVEGDACKFVIRNVHSISDEYQIHCELC